jgi:hypothetical protein
MFIMVPPAMLLFGILLYIECRTGNLVLTEEVNLEIPGTVRCYGAILSDNSLTISDAGQEAEK